MQIMVQQRKQSKTNYTIYFLKIQFCYCLCSGTKLFKNQKLESEFSREVMKKSR